MATAREELANMLRQARIAAGYASQGEFAKKLHKSRPVVTRAESPANPAPADDVLDAWTEITGLDAVKLQELAKEARSGNPEWFMPYEHEESKAHTIRCFSPLQVPGLLQAESYARETLSVDRYTPERLAELVKARMARKDVLERACITAIIDEHVLRRCIGSPAVMGEQCGYVVSLAAEHPNFALHVVPEGVNTGLGGGFSMATRGGLTIVALTTAVRDITSTAEDVVTEAVQRFERLLGAALPCEESLDCARAMEEKWKAQKI
jgi:hypothetical protein